MNYAFEWVTARLKCMNAWTFCLMIIKKCVDKISHRWVHPPTHIFRSNTNPLLCHHPRYRSRFRTLYPLPNFYRVIHIMISHFPASLYSSSSSSQASHPCPNTMKCLIGMRSVAMSWKSTSTSTQYPASRRMGVWKEVLGHKPCKGCEVHGERMCSGKALCVGYNREKFSVYCGRLLCEERMSSCIYLFGNVSL
jgi:hypothetical protein